MICNHNEEAKLLVVKKEGPNQGREFYACARSKEEQCTFFEWANQNHTPKDSPGVEKILEALRKVYTHIDEVKAEILEKCAPR